MKLLTQSEVINELNKYSNKTITKQAFYDRTKKGQIKFHYKPNSKKSSINFMKLQKFMELKLMR